MKGWRKTPWFIGLVLVLGSAIYWQAAGLKAILAIASLSDPAKLAQLRERGANPRLNKVLYWLDQARSHWVPAGTAVSAAQIWNGTHSPRAALVKRELLRNLKLGDELGLFTPANRDHLRHGRAAIVTRGPYQGQPAEVDHIVPISLAPELGNELANLEVLPERLNRQKSNQIGPRQLALAEEFFHAGILSETAYDRVKAQSR